MGRSRGGKRRRGEGNGWEGFGGYMQAKVQKLRGQFRDDEDEHILKKSDIFRGISIHVNGYTNPTWSVLRDLMKTHGGVYQHYYSRAGVSHVIATNLAGSKAASLSPDVKVCSPNWITESIREGRLLPYEDYLLYTARKNKQPGLSVTRISRSATNSSRSSDASITTETGSYIEIQPQMDCESNRENVSEVEENEIKGIEEPTEQNDDESVTETEGSYAQWNESNMDLFDDIEDWEEKSSSEDESEHKDTETGTMKSSDVQTLRSESGSDTVDKNGSKWNITSSTVDMTIKPSDNNAGASRNASSFQSENKSPPQMKSPTYRSPAKAGNPNFIGEFYTNSRLHYLSTWGAEFRAYVNELQSNGANFPGRERLLESVSGKPSGPQPRKLNQKAQRVIMHIDMDSFFVAVGLRNRPELKGKPVAVTHSRGKGAKERPGTDMQYEVSRWKSKKEEKSRLKSASKNWNLDPGRNPDLLLMGFDEDENDDSSTDAGASETVTLPAPQETFHSMAEIASCSYEAREAGVKNGMFMGSAKKLCPDLVTIPYDFEGYRQVSQKLYDIVASYTHDIEAVSCDEMMVDLTELLETTGISPLEFATILRDEIREATQCNASAGLGPNILVARLATRLAKPNGQHWVQANEVLGFVKDRTIRELPGVGYAMSRKLRAMGIENCGDLQSISLQVLQKEFGPKTGQTLYKSCRGQDDRPIKIERERKSVSAEINYGIRFTEDSEATKFLEDLAQEVHNRMEKIKVKAKTFTLKLKVRSADAPRETAKFLGHGICDSVAKSVTLPLATDSAELIARECILMLKNLKVKTEDLRGIGIQGSKLESATFGQRPAQAPGMQSILNFATKTKQSPKAVDDQVKLADTSKLEVSPVKRTPQSEEVGQGSSHEVKVQDQGIVQGQGREDDMEDDAAIEVDPMNTSLPPLPTLPDLSSSFSSQQGAFAAAVTPMRQPRKLDDEYFFSPSQIDLEVLQELPEDIRKQVVQDMKRQKRKKQQTNAKQTEETPGVRQQTTTAPSGVNVTHNSQEPGCSHWSNKPNTDVVMLDGSDEDSGNYEKMEIGKTEAERVSEERTVANDEPIVPLPAYSQIDPTFLDALPAELRNELQKAYAVEKRSKEDERIANELPVRPQMSPATSPFKTFENLMAAGRSSPMKTNISKSPRKTPRKSPGKAGVPRGRGRGRGSRGRGSRGRARASLVEILSPKKQGANETPNAKTPENEANQAEPEQPWIHQPPDLCGATELPAVKTLLTEWINSSNEPENADSDQVIQYLNQLIQEKYLDVCHLVLKFLLRFISKKKMAAWSDCLDNIVAQTQNIVIAFHGAPLKL